MAMSIETTGQSQRSKEARQNRRSRLRRRGMRLKLTAMIDVTFLLLLFFLLTFTFRPTEGAIPGSLARGRGIIPPPPRPEPIRISVRPVGRARDGAIYQPRHYPLVIRTPRELGEFLLRRARHGTDTPVIIQCSRDVQWQWAVEAFNQAVRAKFKTVSFDTPT